MPLFNPHLFFHLQNLLFFGLVVHPGYTAELQPAIIVFIIPKLPQNNVNRVPILSENHIVGNTQLNQLVRNKTKYK